MLCWYVTSYSGQLRLLHSAGQEKNTGLATVLCDREGNRRSGVAQTVIVSTYRRNCLCKMSHTDISCLARYGAALHDVSVHSRCWHVYNRRRLRSASSNQLDVPSFRLPTVGSRAFPIAGAKVWNSLPDDVTSAPSLSTFRRLLKIYLFLCCYNTD